MTVPNHKQTQHAEKKGLLSEIRRAFADTLRPPDNECFAGINIDDETLEAEFAGCERDRLTVDFALQHNMSLLYFTPAAFHYYLPAYLTLCLQNPTEMEDLLDVIVRALTPSRPPGMPSGDHSQAPESDLTAQRLSMLSPRQLEVTKATFQYFRRYHSDLFTEGEKMCVDNYWDRLP